jgi:signal transduction histidine kinase/CheY-like chemotaxis protein
MHTSVGQLGCLLEQLPEPALLLAQSDIAYCNQRFLAAVPDSGAKLRVASELAGIARDSPLPTIANVFLGDEVGGSVYAVTLTLVKNGHDYVSATFRNIRDLDPHTLTNVLQEERFKSCALPDIAFGISELDRSFGTTTWIYLSPAAYELLRVPAGPGVAGLLRDPPRKWWIADMLALDRNGGFVHINDGLQRFPELQVATVSLKRIADGPTGLRRYFWLAAEPATSKQTPAEKLEQLVKARTWELEEAMQSKSRFLNTVSHEIRTPLCGIMGSLALLDDGPLLPEQAQVLRIATLCGEQLLVLINDILDRAKMDENKLSLEQLPFAVHDLLADSLEMMATLAAQKGLELILDISPTVPLRALGDPFRLRQIFLNLVSNACKFTKEGHVLLRASAAPRPGNCFTLHVMVEDTGIGMSAEVRARLFQPFTQGDQSTRRKFGGTGLGLSIAQHLALLMSGTITAESTEGSGSRFLVKVSLAHSGEPSAPLGPLFDRSLQTKLLLVIRNVTLRAILLRQLTDWKFRVVAVGTSTEALALHKADFTLMIADINGWKDDHNLLQQFNITTILLRQGGEEERLKQALTKSGGILVSKPVRTSELYDALSRALNPFQAAPTLIAPERGEKRHPLRILLAEDNVTNQLIIGKMLRRLGQTNVTTVADGLLAVEACKTTHFDLIFMDIMMPVLNGWEAAQQIRAHPSGSRVFIAALTAISSTEDRQQCLEAGMDRVLSKPIVVSDLVDAVDAASRALVRYHNLPADVSA